MGLDVSHGAWHGAYSRFARFRAAIAEVVGFHLGSMEGFERGDTKGLPWSTLPPDPLHALLNHSDCDGEIAPEHLTALATRLHNVASKLGEFEEDAIQFAKGCERAWILNEPLEFC